MQLLEQQTDLVLVPELVVADTLWSRFIGLMFRRDFVSGFGLLLKPCTSVHTMFMRANIDIYFIDKEYKIVDRRLTVGPRRIILPKKKAAMVLEIPSGGIHLEVGTMVKIKI